MQVSYFWISGHWVAVSYTRMGFKVMKVAHPTLDKIRSGSTIRWELTTCLKQSVLPLQESAFKKSMHPSFWSQSFK